MATRSLNVVIAGDAKPLGIAAKQADAHISKIGSAGARMGKTLALGFAGAGAAAGGALVVGLKKSVDAAKEAEVSQAKLKAQLQASGISYRAHAKDIDAVIQKHSRLAGVDDEDLQDAFTNLVRSTGSVSKSMHDMGLVTDIARAKHIDVTKAADLLGKVHAGNTAVLKRYGIAFDPVTKAQDKLKESNKKATVEQIAAAKATDKTATSQKAIAELQKRFGGQAAAYGKTAAGASDRFHVALENVEEKLGKGLLPILAKVTGGVATFLQGIDSGKGVGGRFATAMSAGFNRVKTTVQTVVAAVRGYLTRHREDIQSVIDAFQRVARFARTTWQETLLPIVRRTVAAIKPIVQGVADLIRGIVRTISGLLSGNWSKAWSGAKEAVSGAWKVIKTVVSTGVQNLWEVVKDLGPKLIKLILKGLEGLGKSLATGIFEGIKAAASAIPGLAAGALKGIGHAITSAITKSLGKINLPFGVGDGVGKSPLPAGTFGGGLHGADPRMAPFASMASRFGLGISAGRSDHDVRTTSGNLSYHGTGEALDFSNGYETPQEMAFARYMVSSYGGRLAELIYTPLGFSIKDGRRVSPIDASAHHDHVHVAFDLGRPGVGIGDGPGRRRFTGDGIGRTIQAAYAEGLRGEQLVDMVAIAGRESGFNPGAMNLKPPDHSIGLWQINQLAHHGEFGTDAQLKNPRTNAHAMAVLLRARPSMMDWNHAGGPLGGTNVAQARAAVQRFLSGTRGGSGGSGGGSSGGSSVPRIKTFTAQVTNPLTGRPGGTVSARGGTVDVPVFGPVAAGRTYAGALDQIGLGLAEAKGNYKKTMQLIAKEGILKQTRLAKIRRTLKRQITKALRTSLTQEATSLVEDLRALGELAYEISGGTTGISPGGNVAGTPAEAAERAADAPKPDAPDLPTAGDFVDAAIAEAALTPDTADDIAAASGAVGYWESQLAAARASGDPRRVTAAAGGLKSARDNLTALQGNTEATNNLADALKGVQDEIKRQTDFATSVANTSNFQLTKTLADLISGHIVGYGVAGRSFTPGTGVEVAYMYSAI